MSNFINNAGVNYTLYYNVLDYFKTIMNNHPSIAFVSQGDLYSIDVNEFPTYPLGNILINGARFDGKTTVYRCQLMVGDKVKQKNNESQGIYNDKVNPFYGSDDVVDIHANSFAILNDLISFTSEGTTNFNIIGSINIEAFVDRYDNGLAGWVASFDLQTFNDRPKCLFNLLDQNDVNTQLSC
jgi:hypothetical protein